MSGEARRSPGSEGPGPLELEGTTIAGGARSRERVGRLLGVALLAIGGVVVIVTARRSRSAQPTSPLVSSTRC
jgi:hypothetical protein